MTETNPNPGQRGTTEVFSPTWEKVACICAVIPLTNMKSSLLTCLCSIAISHTLFAFYCQGNINNKNIAIL